MGKTQIITPILIQVNNKKYKFLYISFAADGSAYLTFPRKKGYKIKAHKEISVPIKGERKVTLETLDATYISPYISFHPKKSIIHINCLENKFKADLPVLNMSEDKNIKCFPIAQIIYPNNSSYLDEYVRDKYTAPLIFNVKDEKADKGLNIELWIHSLSGYIDPKDLPLKEKRGNLVGCLKFSNQYLKTYTCTVVASEVSLTKEEKHTPGIVIAVFNAETPFVFELVPEQ